jgi:hypothetical protein
MYAWLLQRHGKARNGYYYTDEGIDVNNATYLMGSPCTKTTIIGLARRGNCDSPYILEVERFERKHHLAISREDQ